jgi:hypothetical protein
MATITRDVGAYDEIVGDAGEVFVAIPLGAWQVFQESVQGALCAAAGQPHGMSDTHEARVKRGTAVCQGCACDACMVILQAAGLEVARVAAQ